MWLVSLETVDRCPSSFVLFKCPFLCRSLRLGRMFRFKGGGCCRQVAPPSTQGISFLCRRILVHSYILCRFAIFDGHGILVKSLSKLRRVKILGDAVIIDPIWTASERGGYRVWFDGRDGISRNGLYVEVIDVTICLVIDGHEWCSRTMSISLPCMRLSDVCQPLSIARG